MSFVRRKAVMHVEGAVLSPVSALPNAVRGRAVRTFYRVGVFFRHRSVFVKLLQDSDYRRVRRRQAGFAIIQSRRHRFPYTYQSVALSFVAHSFALFYRERVG